MFSCFVKIQFEDLTFELRYYGHWGKWVYVTL
jgi:hypothetical protein